MENGKRLNRDASITSTLHEVMLFLFCLSNSKYKMIINAMPSFLIILTKLDLHPAQNWHNAAALHRTEPTLNLLDSCVFPNCISSLTVPPVKLRGIVQLFFFQMEEAFESKEDFFSFAIFLTTSLLQRFSLSLILFLFLSNSSFSRLSVGW